MSPVPDCADPRGHAVVAGGNPIATRPYYMLNSQDFASECIFCERLVTVVTRGQLDYWFGDPSPEG